MIAPGISDVALHYVALYITNPKQNRTKREPVKTRSFLSKTFTIDTPDLTLEARYGVSSVDSISEKKIIEKKIG